jgi:hypothetical protein
MPSALRAPLLIALSLLPTVAPAEGSVAQRYLDAASMLYQKLENERALEQLKKARTASTGVDDDVAIALYEGIILSDMGKKEEAIAAFREGLSLKPDAQLPMKVAPKIAELFATTRADVVKQLAPILAQRKAEEERKRLEAERAQKAEQERLRLEAEQARKAEEAQRAAIAAEAERLRLETEKVEAARSAAVNEAERKKLEQERAELEKKVAELAAQRRQAEADAKRREEETRRREEEARQRALAMTDRPEQKALTPGVGEAKPDLFAPAPRPVPVAPIVLGVLTVGAGVVAGVFGGLAASETDAARQANFQSDTVRHLNQANSHALVSNVALGGAGALGIATVISLLVSRDPPPPPPRVQESP